MKNLRILYDNAADRAILTASSQAGTLGPANLQRDHKSSVLRSAGAQLNIVATWPTAELVACVALIFTNMTSSARMRVRGYAQPGDAVPVLDTGSIFPCPAAVHGSYPWGVLPLGWNTYQWGGVNTWPLGGGSDGVAWFAPVRVRRLVIDVSAPQSPEGYLEISRLVVGNYWSPQHNAEYGAQVQMQDSSENYRTGAGNLKTVPGTTSDKLSINLAHLTPMDRARFMRILRENGKGKAMLFSLFPENPDPLLEQDYMLYGKVSNIEAVTTPYFETYSAPLQIEGI
ncbi:hypothetical protein OPV09_18995 [Janthinobacterium sp. TB1-E2]|uniref:Uncharacterized protein n=2 Tax=Janthinobacterium TaxID=29580 RepID=A0AB38C4E0_9BURK|nr:hypothetical protein [Janthinobacterium lividum]SFX23327.1 hypothetical protein SAMN03097694_1276 [Janthinobacterium lividum]